MVLYFDVDTYNFSKSKFGNQMGNLNADRVVSERTLNKNEVREG
jgi:hypothetical protein